MPLICLGSYRIKAICIITYWFIAVMFVGLFMNNILRVHFKFDLCVRISRLRTSFLNYITFSSVFPEQPMPSRARCFAQEVSERGG